MGKHLHLVCFDVPFPPNYGGVFDLYYKIVALHQQGVLIHLHCFRYGRDEQPVLNKYCVEVKYYNRETGLGGISLTLPYIVSSRSNKTLLKDLIKDNYPVLLEGIHCSYFVFSEQLANRNVFIRLHNVECEYYKNLAQNSRSFFKRIYYNIESHKLRRYEKMIGARSNIITVSISDLEYYKKYFLAAKINMLPIFIPWTPKSPIGFGKFCLYHGNLSVAENESAALWLIKNISGQCILPLVIAGHFPSPLLLKLASTYKVKIIPDPSDIILQELINEAQVNVLPSFNNTGVKLKLLNALFNGRHSLVNMAADKGSGLEVLSHHAETIPEFISKINQLSQLPLEQDEQLKRQDILMTLYDNAENARKLMSWLY